MKKLLILLVLFLNVASLGYGQQKLHISNGATCSAPLIITMFIRAHDNTYTSCACIGFQNSMQVPSGSTTYNIITDFDIPGCMTSGSGPGWWEGCSTFSNICADATGGNWDYDLITVNIGGTAFPVAYNTGGGSCLSSIFSWTGTHNTACGTYTVDFYMSGGDYFLDIY